ASVVYASAQFAYYLLNLYGLDLGFINFGDAQHVLLETFVLFALFLTIHSLINIFSSPLVAMFNNISVGWHLRGVCIIIAVLIIVPDEHQSLDFVFTEKFNNTGLFDGNIGGFSFWFYVLPLGFLLTMYTQTGYDASAHISEETKGAAVGAAKGVWRSVFWAGAIGWLVPLALTLDATQSGFVTNQGLGSSLSIFSSSLDPWAAKMVILI